MRITRVWGIIAMGFATLAIAGCGSSDDESGGGSAANSGDGGDKTVRIGFSGALSGPYAAYDAPLRNGMDFAAKEINDQGGIDGYKVEVVSKDNKGDQAATAQTTQELLDDGIKLFVLTTGPTSVASGQLATQAGGIASVGANTAPDIVKSVGDRAFMIVYGDNAQAAAGAEYSCDQGYKTAYLLGSNEIPYTKFIPRYFKDAFAKDCGGQISGEDSFKIGQTDFNPQVAKIKSADPQPDVIYTSMFIPDFGAFMKQLRSAGVETPVVTVDGNDSALLADSAGNAADGVVLSTSTFPTDGNAAEKFFADFQQATGKKPETNAVEAMGRDNVYALVEAAAAAKSTDPDAVLDAVNSFKDKEFVTGKLTMSADQPVPEKDVFLVKVDGTDFTFLKQFKPENTPAP
jgi:branched-chain amino acid transport system substrate-binding protein